jgi:hypothetical protein
MLVAEKEKQEQDVGISHEAEKTMFDAHVRDTELPLHQYQDIPLLLRAMHGYHTSNKKLKCELL